MDPDIKVTPPGPRALEILGRDAKVISQSMVRDYPLVIDRASGLNIWDVDGNRYLDFSAGIAVMNLGWNHQKVVDAIISQAGTLTHGAFLDFCSELPVKFAEKLVQFLPSGLDRVYFSNSGAETVEAAIKLAKYHTKRTYFISFYGSFHGRTYGAMSLTAAKVIQRKHFGPFLPVIHAPYPNPYRHPGRSACDLDVIAYIEDEVFRTEVSPEEVAAIIVEPIQGEGGYVVPPVSFLKNLRSLCDEYGILLIADEVQSGCYRTGKFLASMHSEIVPDIVCLSKALGGGLPFGVTVSSEEIMNWPPGSHASTFGGNNLACAAGLAVLEVMSEDGFGDHVTDMGVYLLNGLEKLRKKHELIGDVRGIGLMAGIELVRNRVSKEPASRERDAALMCAFEQGLTLLPAGESVIRFCPPLTITPQEIDSGLSLLDDALSATEGF